MKARITLITLGVDDLEKSLAFYRDGLGLATPGIIGQEFEHGAVVFIELQSGLKLALWPRARFCVGPQRELAAGSRCGDGTGRPRRSNNRQGGATQKLGRLRRLFPGPGRAFVGSSLEPTICH